MRKNRKFFSNSKLKPSFCLFFALLCSILAHAQALNARYLEYIEQYKSIAVQHQRDYGVPASITLAQGLLESNAGRSYLARNGNNHFGIKCYSWKGPVVEYDDTLQHDCYRNYGCVEDSFLDHAKFLKGKRYSTLYELDVNDYQGWAQGLRDCGYAEDPAYPQKLIALIEQYELHLIATPSPAQVKNKKAYLPPPGEPTKKHTASEKTESRAEIDRHAAQRSRVTATRGTARSGRVAASADND